MTREEAKTKLISFGIAEPTKEQIDDLLNSVNAEVQNEKGKHTKDAERIKELEAKEQELNDLKSKDMTETEKATKALEQANNRIAELEKAQALSSRRISIAEKWKITAEQASQILKDDGSFDDEALGKIIADKETAAATAKEQEIANNSNNPGGGNGGSNNQTEAEKIASQLFATDNKSGEQSVLSHYC